MFPSISDLLEYLFNIYVYLPIPTFGFFVATAFILSYLTFSAEFKRKEALGVIRAYEAPVRSSNVEPFMAYFEYMFLGFLIGFKVVGALIYHELFLLSPLTFIFSFQGSLWSAAFFSILFALLLYWQRGYKKTAGKLQEKIAVHPYQLMPKLVLWAAIWGFLGAKIFNYLENFEMYNSYSLSNFLKYSGLTFLGGLICGGLSFLYIGYMHGMKLIDLADIGSPGMLVAYGVGRIGCHLSGDGDWGRVNHIQKPFSWLPEWMWTFRFPHNVLNQGEYISGCTVKYCFILPEGVYPTSFYESAIILFCFLLVWSNRRRIYASGQMFCFYLIVIGTERFFMEFLRLNFKYSIFGWPLSQAQIISLVFLFMALPVGIYVRRLRRKAMRFIF